MEQTGDPVDPASGRRRLWRRLAALLIVAAVIGSYPWWLPPLQQRLEQHRAEVAGEKARMKTCHEDLGALIAKVRQFETSHGRFPQFSEIQPELGADPWGHAYRYSVKSSEDRERAKISSNGPDGIEPTEDDLDRVLLPKGR